MSKKWICFAIILLMISVGVFRLRLSQPENTQELIIFAAASLSDVFSELVEQFNMTNSDVRVSLNLASSGTLQIQIEQGARADIFASAGKKQMDVLLKQGLMQSKSVKTFAENRLVIAGLHDSSHRLIQPVDLLQREVSELGIADPATVPAGQYAVAALKSLGLWERLQAKLIYGGNVRQVLQYIERGEVDLGFIYLTDALVSKKVKVFYTLPTETHPLIEYPIGLVAESQNQKLGEKFLEWVLSDQGQKILMKYGFLTVE